MTNKHEVVKLIDETELIYCKCWDVLCSLKGKKPFAVKEILEFQFILGNALYNLSKKYRNIFQAERIIIQEKNKLSPEWFKKRLKKLSEYKQAINNTIAIGKSIGDGFAWFFYQKERKCLVEHLRIKHNKNLHMPPGLGGIGELEFVKNIKGLEGHLTIYHGTTNLLRIGDISFINLETLELTALGEIKTQRVDGNTIKIKLALISPISKKNFSFFTLEPRTANTRVDRITENACDVAFPNRITCPDNYGGMYLGPVRK